MENYEVEVIKANRKLTNRTNSDLSDTLKVAPYARVSTDTEEQLSSYQSQVQHYTDMVDQRSDWTLVDIYADEAITGTQTVKREDFQRLINDCIDGKIDMIITKSISRFARNTLDTLKHVRQLKEKNIAVLFEDENINTMTMDGELLLTILSSVAQQEVENISANVKKGLQMKMQRGTMVGFQSCLGYDYDPQTKEICINKAEAQIVRYIFRRYIEGIGTGVITRELMQAGLKTKKGSEIWRDSTVLFILKNEKYKGDLLQGKSFTVDPISKRRLANFGEVNQYYVKNHHEPIISREVFDKAQDFLNRRSKAKLKGKRKHGKTGGKYSRLYTFSSLLECAHCGNIYSRRSWHAETTHKKTVWECVTKTKKGKKYCLHSKAAGEAVLEEAFVQSYRKLCRNHKEVLNELLHTMESLLMDKKQQKRLDKLSKEINHIEQKSRKLLDLLMEEEIDKISYDHKRNELQTTEARLREEKEKLERSIQQTNSVEARIKKFQEVLTENDILPEFDRHVFESITEKVIMGDPTKQKPNQITFIFKTGERKIMDGKRLADDQKKPVEKERSEPLSLSFNNTGRERDAVGAEVMP
ncbi:recombinase family protein [Natribacillus halophilus]|uniref:Site-specific DNA recombinase n=1 Tax=Natribacillus halophilus TaxID=549003 RepID=A0A1G8Q1S5_9BACI|nr:recombinase family protein [Natribacillus halophilus]SDI98405.1 Site-specific DNA recombinase [Natribacillus halophilus]